MHELDENGRLRLWTFQSQEIAKALANGESFRSKPDFQAAWGQEDAHAWGFRHAYDWMNEQMAKRIGPAPDGCVYPVWAWARPPQATKSGGPDLRSMRYEDSNALIEISVPRELALISNFGTWHCALNGWPHGLDEAACDALDDRIDKLRSDAGRTQKKGALLGAPDFADPAVMALVSATWEWIFDVESFKPGDEARMAPGSGGDPEWTDVLDISAQATLWEIRPEHMVGWRPVAPRTAKPKARAP